VLFRSSELRWQAGQVQYRETAQASWKTATGPDSVFADRGPTKQLAPSDFFVAGKLPARYQGNDFGHQAFYLERGGRVQGHMVHPSPSGEARYGDDSFELTESHGCEHMRPADLDEARAKGYLKKGTPFLVRGYEEGLPEDVLEFIAAESET
jgi:hypothetical protein